LTSPAASPRLRNTMTAMGPEAALLSARLAEIQALRGPRPRDGRVPSLYVAPAEMRHVAAVDLGASRPGLLARLRARRNRAGPAEVAVSAAAMPTMVARGGDGGDFPLAALPAGRKLTR